MASNDLKRSCGDVSMEANYVRNDQKKSGPSSDSGSKSSREEPKIATLLSLYATGADWMLMLIGTLCACVHGACFPMLLTVFGDMIDMFLNASNNITFNSTMLHALGCNWTISGYGWSQLVPPDGDPEKLYNVLSQCELISNIKTLVMEEMSTFALYYVYLAVTVIVLGYGQVSTWLLAAQRESFKVRTVLFRAIVRKDIGWFDTHDVSELNSRLTEDIRKFEMGIGDKISYFLQHLSSFVTCMLIGFLYGWKLSLVILSMSPLFVLMGVLFTKMSSVATTGQLTAYAKAEAVAQEVLSSIRTVFAFDGQEKESRRYYACLKAAQRFGIRSSMYVGGSSGTAIAIQNCAFALAFWYGSKLIISDPENYTGGTVITVFFVIMFGGFSLGSAGPYLQYVAEAKGAIGVIWDLINKVPDIDSFSEEGIRRDALLGHLQMKDVSFSYPARPDVKVLDGLSISITAGQTAALVGGSGCGKSTVVQLLQRLYDPQSGAVRVDGTDVRDYNVTWLRRQIGEVTHGELALIGGFQKGGESGTCVIATTIKENIMLGRDGVSMVDVIEAAKTSNAFDFINKLPKKFETVVGERGTQLSGGQRQRIAIARALVSNPRILLLDEATSALDSINEAAMQHALHKASQGRTTVVIAHRLSTIKNADVIFTLQDGRVVEQGSHDDLMSKGPSGIFHHLLNKQIGNVCVSQGTDDNMSLHEDKNFNEEINLPDVWIPRYPHVINPGKYGDDMKYEVEEPLLQEQKPVEFVHSSTFLRMMKMNAPEWPYLLTGSFFCVINGVVQPLFGYILAETIGSFVKPSQELREESVRWAILFLVLGLIRGLSQFFVYFMFGISGEKLTMRVRDLCFRAYMKQEMAYFDDVKNSTATLCAYLRSDASAIQGTTGDRISLVLRNLSSIVAALIIAFYYSWKMALLVIVIVPMMALTGAVQMSMRGNGGRSKDADQTTPMVIEVIQNIRTVVSLTKEAHFCNKYAGHLLIHHRNAVKRSHVTAAVFSLSQSMIYLVFAALFYLGAYLVEHESLYFEHVFKVFAPTSLAAMAVGRVTQLAPDFGKARAAADRTFLLLERESKIDSSSKKGSKLATVNGMVRFKKVSFHYPSRPEAQVLQNLDLSIQPGQSVAIIGSSGCGKSTVVSLMERFYDVTSGEIQLDGRDIRSLNTKWLRAQLAVVEQEPVLFATSIKDNIAYGALREPSMDDVIQAARVANIHEFVRSLPQGYDTNVGDKGTQLSGGQKQRIAIARALIRHPKILLLDEATSALDSDTEQVVLEALEKAQQARTSIVIAHRISTIQNADCIFAIRNGAVFEKGTHKQLLNSKGTYYKIHVTGNKNKDI